MCSPRMQDLVLTNDNAQYECGYQSGKNKGPVALAKISNAIITRAALLRAIDALEKRGDWWGHSTEALP